MTNDQSDLVEPLKKFRLELMKALADIQVQLQVLEQAVRGQTPVSEKTLKGLREKARAAERSGKQFLTHYAETIPLPHEMPRK